MAADKLQLIADVPMFSACTKQEVKRIAALANRVDVGEGQVLTAEGDRGKEFYIIAEGEASVTVRGNHVATLGPGEFFGETALLDPGPRTATVSAATPMVVYKVEGEDFRSLLIDVPFIARNILRGIARRMRELTEAPTH
ncbi:MAG: cyclic nucleotide-binding domain-containing protein [Actinomycetota bacterium]|nr:cyclic nucleotide-binding domain-containing protein [Actinomycetota bacterium]